MTRRATVIVAAVVAVLGLAIGIGVDVIDDGESAEADAGSAADGGVIPDRPCVLALVLEDPEAIGGGVYSVATVTGDDEPIRISGDEVATHPDISPDGERVAYVRAIGDYESAGPEGTEVWTVGTDGSDPTPVLAEGGYAQHPRWSPDGRTIALARSVDGGEPELVYVAAGGSEPAIVVPASEDDAWASIEDLTWSPDGRSIAYLARFAELGRQVTEVRIVGVAVGEREVRTLAEIPFGATIDWSPDGSSLLVAGGDNGETEGLHLVDPETGEARELAPGAGLARWAGGGDRAYVIRFNGATARQDGGRWELVDAGVPRGPAAAPDRTIREAGNPYYGMAVGPTC